MICLGFSHDGKKLTKHNPPKLQFGKNNRIYTITTIPAPADLPFGDEPPRLLHLDGEIPHQTIDVRQENHRLSVPPTVAPSSTSKAGWSQSTVPRWRHKNKTSLSFTMPRSSAPS